MNLELKLVYAIHVITLDFGAYVLGRSIVLGLIMYHILRKNLWKMHGLNLLSNPNDHQLFKLPSKLTKSTI